MSSDDNSAILSVDATVFFPPRQHADFLIHYDDTAFHVHNFILHCYSAYFRTYFDTLSESPDSNEPSAKKSKRCIHPFIACCIQLPQQTTLGEKTPVTASDFRHFLCHLYFASHYCYPPYLPKTDIDLSANLPPLSLTFPAITELSWTSAPPRASSPLRITPNGECFIHNEALLTLAHYFDCAAIMAQCEAVLTKQVECAKQVKRFSVALVEMCFDLLQDADIYHLAHCKKACIEVIAADKGVLERDAYKELKRSGNRSLLVEAIQAVINKTNKRSEPARQRR